MEELWCTLDFEEGYQNYSVSNLGRIKNVRTGTILKPDISNMGYERFNLYNAVAKKQKKHSGHRLVALYFVEGDKELTVNHKDGNKRNNVYTNLEWSTQGENNSHAFQTGLKSQDGTKNPSNAYDEKKIHKICYLLELGWNTKEISESVFDTYENKYKNLINHIKGRRRWTTISQSYNF
jgi:NUMOD4 motif/HNH endonuclease